MSKEKIVENMGAVSDKLVQYMDAAEQVITQYGGDAVNLGLNVLRIEAGQNLFIGIALCVVMFYLYRFTPKGGKTYGKEMDLLILKGYVKRSLEEDALVLVVTGSGRTSSLGTQWGEPIVFIPAMFGFTAGLIALVNLLNIWNWIGIFWPQAYAVHKFLM